MVYPDLPIADRRNDDLVRLTLPEPPATLDLESLFGNDHPVEIEIGTGKGRFLLLAATARPDVNFIGVEYAARYLSRAVDRIAKRALSNVRLVHAEAADLLETYLPEGSLSGCHIYFPDPWPKKRHHKRRIIRPDVLALLARSLHRGALLRIATDHAHYAAAISETLALAPDFEQARNSKEYWELPGMGDYTRAGVTNFEIKYRREGREIHRFVWIRR